MSDFNRRWCGDKNMKHLIIGLGEVGSALHVVLGCFGYDPNIEAFKDTPLEADVLHICYPYTPRFNKATQEYIAICNPSTIVIHSTVPIGTTRQFGERAVHSPVRGQHPNLAASLNVFTKYIGAVDQNKGKQVKAFLEQKGIPCKVCSSPETTEALKLLDTTYYGMNIAFMKRVLEFCKQEGLDFEEVYTHPNKTYNTGYKEMGKEYVVRPVLKAEEGKIGGHCIIPNSLLLLGKPKFKDVVNLILNIGN